MFNRKKGVIAEVMIHFEQPKLLKVCQGIISLPQLQLGRCNSPPQGRVSLGFSRECHNSQFVSQRSDYAVAQHLLERGKPQRKRFLDYPWLPHD